MNKQKCKDLVVVFIMIFFIWLYVVVILGLSQNAHAQETEYKLVVAEGVSALMPGKPVDKAYDEAVKDAKRNAVQSGLGVLVSSETLVKNYQVVHDRILAQSAGYVRNFKVISKNNEGDLYRVVIEAEVALATINSDLIAVGILKSEKGYPRIMIIGVEKVDGENMTTISSQTVIEDFLVSKGFDLVDESQVKEIKMRDEAMNSDDLNKAAALGKKFGAEVIILLEGLADYAGASNVYGAQMESYRGSVNARMIYTDTADMLGSANAKDQATGEGKPAAARLAFEKAGKKVAPVIMQKILDDWQKHTNKMELVVSGVNYSQLKKIGAAVKTIRGVDAVASPQFDKGVAVFRIQGNLLAEDLADSLDKTEIGSLLDVTGISPGRVEAEVQNK